MNNLSYKKLRENITGDMKVYHLDLTGRSLAYKIKALRYLKSNSPGFNCVFWYRINRFLYENDKNMFIRWAANRLSIWRVYRFGNDISYKAHIGAGFRVVHLSDIVIGTGAKIGENFTILNGVTLGKKNTKEKKMPIIGNNVYLGTGSKLVGGIEIGDNVVVGALTFCNKSIPSNSTAYGNPMVIVDEKR